MKTLKNRILSGAMAGILAVSLAVPAFAAGNTTEVKGTFKAVTIAVDVMPKAVAFINPYGLDIDVPQDGITETAGAATTKISGQQIVSAPMALKNKTGMDLTVNATVTTTIPAAATGEVAMKLAANTTKGAGSDPTAEGYIAPATAKSAFVYLEAKQEPTLIGADSAVNAAAVAAKFATWTPSTFDATKHAVLNATRAVTMDNLVTLRAADMSGASGAFAAYKAGSVALVRLAGDCVTAPKDEWKTTDTFTAAITYSFAPADITKYAVTLNPTGKQADDTLTVDSSNAAAGDVVTITAALGGTSTGVGNPIVKKADGTAFTPAISVVAGASNTWTFTMPAEAVRIDITFS